MTAKRIGYLLPCVMAASAMLAMPSAPLAAPAFTAGEGNLLASASGLSAVSPGSADIEAASERGVNTAHSRRWRGGDYYGRGYRHRPKVDAGDIITGIVLIGTIATIANAAKRASRADAERYPTSYPDDNARARSGGGVIRAAMDNCLRAVERDVRVDGIDSVRRTGNGWQVNGSLYNGEGFRCQVTGDGEVIAIDYLGSGSAYPAAQGDEYRPSGPDNQLADAAYAEAWRRTAPPMVSAMPTGTSQPQTLRQIVSANGGR